MTDEQIHDSWALLWRTATNMSVDRWAIGGLNGLSQQSGSCAVPGGIAGLRYAAVANVIAKTSKLARAKAYLKEAAARHPEWTIKRLDEGTNP